MLLLPATITAHEARDVLRMLAQALQRETESTLTIDAGGLQHFDSSALAVLLECERLAEAWGKSFVVKSAPAKLESLAKLYGVDVLLFKQAPAETAAV